jgi:hypothetical protein
VWISWLTSCAGHRDVSPDNGTIAIEKNATIEFLPQETAFQVRETLSAFVGGNDEPVSIVAIHSNIAFDFVELKLDGVLRDGWRCRTKVQYTAFGEWW